MKKHILFLSFATITTTFVIAQSADGDSSKLIALNQQMDTYVVQKDVKSLENLYADDFVFSHGSGRVEGKAGWLTTVGRANYSLRQNDSVKAELHRDIAILKGRLDIKKVNPQKTDSYHLRYIRVFAFRGQRWQLISHSTTAEWHDE